MDFMLSESTRMKWNDPAGYFPAGGATYLEVVAGGAKQGRLVE
jgi:hypothetical protein